MSQCFLAYFDVLGYEARIRNKTLEEESAIQEKVLDSIRKSIGWATKGVDFSLISSVHFSDTFIFYSKNDSDKSFASLIASALLFMILSPIRGMPYFPMRGTVSYGDFLADHEKRIYIGSALRDAYRFEKNQDWMGCCLTQDCVE